MKPLQRGQLPLLTHSSLEHSLQNVCPQGMKAAPLCLTMHTQQLYSIPPPLPPSSTSSSSSSSSNTYAGPTIPACLSVSSNNAISDILGAASGPSSSPSPSSSSSSASSSSPPRAAADSALCNSRSSANAADSRRETTGPSVTPVCKRVESARLNVRDGARMELFREN